MKLFIVLGLVSLAFAKKTFFGDQVLTLYPTTDEEVELIRGLNDVVSLVDFWSPKYPSQVHVNSPVDIRVPRREISSLKDTMEKAGIKYEIKIKDLQVAVDNQVRSRENAKGTTYDEHEHDEYYHTYHTYDEIVAWADDIVADYPEATKVQFGTSSEGRDIPMLKLSTKEGNPDILVDCGIHGREWISSAFCQCYVRAILEDKKEILNDLTIFVIPVLNVDGYAYTWSNDRFWRKTRSTWTGSSCVGVDANRNFDVEFGGQGAVDDPCSEVYPGPHAQSENEVKALVDFVNEHKDHMRMYVTFQSYGQMILFPYSHTDVLAADHDELNRVAKDAAAGIKVHEGTEYIYGPAATTYYPASGVSSDWIYNQKVPYSYTIDLRDQGEYGFVLPPEQIHDVCEETNEMMDIMHQAALSL